MFCLAAMTSTLSITYTGVPLWLVLGAGLLLLLIIAATVAVVVYALRH